MIVFIYGPNSYLRWRKLREILSVYGEKMSGQSPKEFDFSEGAEKTLTEELVSYLRSPSIFAEKKFVLVINPFEEGDKKTLKKAFQEVVGDKSQIVVIVSEEDVPKSFDFLLEKPTVFQSFPEIKKGKELDAFIQKEALTRGVKLNKDDIYHLSEGFGTDLWGIATELDSLELSGGKIEEFVSHDFFKTLSGLKYSNSQKDKLVALEVLLTSRGDEAAKVFNILSAGLNDPKKLNALADYDLMIKTGKLDYEEALLDFAINS